MTEETPSEQPRRRSVMLTFTHPAADASDEAFNDWYDNTHVPEIIVHVDGVLGVRRFRLDPRSAAVPPGAPYLAVYEFDCPVGEVLTRFGAAQQKLTPSETLGQGDRAPVTVLYEQISVREATPSGAV